jgi:hypothetical protein
MQLVGVDGGSLRTTSTHVSNRDREGEGDGTYGVSNDGKAADGVRDCGGTTTTFLLEFGDGVSSAERRSNKTAREIHYHV